MSQRGIVSNSNRFMESFAENAILTSVDPQAHGNFVIGLINTPSNISMKAGPMQNVNEVQKNLAPFRSLCQLPTKKMLSQQQLRGGTAATTVKTETDNGALGMSQDSTLDCHSSISRNAIAIRSNSPSESSFSAHGSSVTTASAKSTSSPIICPKQHCWMDNITIKSTPVQKTLPSKDLTSPSRRLNSKQRHGTAENSAMNRKRVLELSEMNLDDYQVMMVDKNSQTKKHFIQSSFHRDRAITNVPKKPRFLLHIPNHQKIQKSPQKVWKPTLLDPCPVIQKLCQASIGDQLYISDSWERRPGVCDPRVTKIFSSSGNSVRYLLQIGMATIGAKVFYCDPQRKVKAEGWITNDGILCSRCGFVVGCKELKSCAGVKEKDCGKHLLLLSSGLPLQGLNEAPRSN